MLRIISLNLNGIRSACRKGFLAWAEGSGADLICLQELKAQPVDLVDQIRPVDGMQAYYHCATKKGYSGVGLWCRDKPDKLSNSLGDAEFDGEGRYLRADFGQLSVVSLYQPSGSSSEARQAAKYRFMALIYPQLVELAASGRDVLVCGDWNIAHQEIDLRNWRSNRNNSGFLPEERAWFGRLLNEAGWHDVYRELYPENGAEGYTWWSNRGQAWARNVGWRIDYQLATRRIAATARRAEVFKEIRFSDHAPLIIDYAYPAQAPLVAGEAHSTGQANAVGQPPA
ncbi:MAG: exodeoxyribonuclease III [Candidatus Accumulibacter sp.]|uniref:exodeoxyribonuclease III n=1 Tax=Accumulibacter sp. TaxID=2053492 RepID=UPI00287950E7|nr:exodeoxyribonuclease III [Accumulibacter sp.]MDS4016297.1 exodeoxyribonuclease III [Accumulibacter sp.]